MTKKSFANIYSSFAISTFVIIEENGFWATAAIFGAKRAAPVTQNNPIFYGNLQHSPDFAKQKICTTILYTHDIWYIIHGKIKLKYWIP